jgi:short-subunit dehydrogenase
MTTNKKNHGVVLITGASSGIGRELALEFSARAETLVLVARRLDRLDQLRGQLLGRYPELKVVMLAADLSDEHEAERLLAQVSQQAGAVDVLVNNAELGDSVLFDRAEWTRTRQILRTNIFALTELTSALVPGMVERAAGEFSTSGWARLTVLPNAAAYVGSKHFVAGLSEVVPANSIKCPAPREAGSGHPRNSSGSLRHSAREKRWPDSSAERPESFQAGLIGLS